MNSLKKSLRNCFCRAGHATGEMGRAINSIRALTGRALRSTGWVGPSESGQCRSLAESQNQIIIISYSAWNRLQCMKLSTLYHFCFFVSSQSIMKLSSCSCRRTWRQTSQKIFANISSYHFWKRKLLLQPAEVHLVKNVSSKMQPLLHLKPPVLLSWDRPLKLMNDIHPGLEINILVLLKNFTDWQKRSMVWVTFEEQVMI